MIYTFAGNPSSVFASVLNMSDTSYSLGTITNQEEIDYINSEIDRVVDEGDNE